MEQTQNLPEAQEQRGECQRFFGFGKKIPKDVKRHCGICRQHGIVVETRGHLCQFKSCDCWKCKLVRQRRSIMSTQIRIRREQDKKFQRTTDATEADVVPWTNAPTEANLNMCYFCQKCKNHGVLMWKKDHKKHCEYANCRCEQCDLIDTRRALDRHIKSNKSEVFENSISSSEVSSSNSPAGGDSPATVPTKSIPDFKGAFSQYPVFPYLDPVLQPSLSGFMPSLPQPLLPLVPNLYSPLPVLSPPILPIYNFDLQLMLNLCQGKPF